MAKNANSKNVSSNKSQNCVNSSDAYESNHAQDKANNASKNSGSDTTSKNAPESKNGY